MTTPSHDAGAAAMSTSADAETIARAWLRFRGYSDDVDTALWLTGATNWEQTARFAEGDPHWSDMERRLVARLAEENARGLRIDLAGVDNAIRDHRDRREAAIRELGLLGIPMNAPPERMPSGPRRRFLGATKALNDLKKLRALPDGRVRNMLNYFGAVTGRHSSGGPAANNLNLQGLPRQLRHLILPEPGHVWVKGDLKQIEPRAMLWLTADEPALDMLRSGADLYEVEAQRIHAGAPRDLGKVLWIAVMYGAGVPALADLVAEKLPGAHVDVPLIHALFQRIHPSLGAMRRALFTAFGQAIDLRCTMQAGVEGRKIQIVSTGGKDPQDIVIEIPTGRPVFFRHAVRSIQGLRYCPHRRREPSGWKDVKSNILFQNVAEAIARDILMAMQLDIEDTVAPVRFSIHDEVWVEAAEGDEERVRLGVQQIMSRVPARFERLTSLPLACKVT